jgi:hypothetical protein
MKAIHRCPDCDCMLLDKPNTLDIIQQSRQPPMNLVALLSEAKIDA